MTVNAFGVAITTFVGQNFGAQRYDRVKKSVRACLGMTVLATAIISTVLLLFGETLYPAVLRRLGGDPPGAGDSAAAGAHLSDLYLH